MTLEATLLAADSAELMADSANMHLQLRVLGVERRNSPAEPEVMPEVAAEAELCADSIASVALEV